MSKFAAFGVGRGAVLMTLTGLVGVWLSGCSADSTRLSETFNSPFSNPFATASSDAAAPTPKVAPAPQVASAPLAPNADYAAAAHPDSAAVAAAPLAEPAATGRIKADAETGVAGSAVGWSAVGGAPIVVGDGDSLDSLSRRYGVPAAAMLKTNGLTNAAQVHAGVRLVVPVYDAKLAAAAGAKTKRLAARDAAAKRERATKATNDAAASAPPSELANKSAAKSAAAESASRLLADAAAPAAKVASPPDPAPTSSVRAADPAAAPLTAAQADAAGVAPEFRWPARGRIIEGFKAGGNDGINIALPEGTSVRAAESGVVAYAGSELKGYGNLVLIRHPNGFVTAYANNGELEVKRGDAVKRGQIIAKSGQSGNVNSPQLHFELRKGSTPVDPINYLAGL